MTPLEKTRGGSDLQLHVLVSSINPPASDAQSMLKMAHIEFRAQAHGFALHLVVCTT